MIQNNSNSNEKASPKVTIDFWKQIGSYPVPGEPFSRVLRIPDLETSILLAIQVISESHDFPADLAAGIIRDLSYLLDGVHKKRKVILYQTGFSNEDEARAEFEEFFINSLGLPLVASATIFTDQADQ